MRIYQNMINLKALDNPGIKKPRLLTGALKG